MKDRTNEEGIDPATDKPTSRSGQSPLFNIFPAKTCRVIGQQQAPG
jgi:hypothetical protein